MRRLIDSAVAAAMAGSDVALDCEVKHGPVSRNVCQMQGRPILTSAALQNHVTQLATQDIIWSPLYDSVSYVTAGQVQLTFFTTPQGQGTTTAPSATGTKTLADTNMTAAGQLTKGNAFYMTGQELVFYPGENPESAAATTINDFINDTWVFSKAGYLTLTIGSNRTYLQDGPAAMFPPVTRLAVAAALTGWAVTNSLVEIGYGVLAGECYTIVPVYIEATLGFQETLSYPAAVALVSANNARVFSRMRGYLNRNAQ